MRNHLKALFIKAKVNDVGVNKILVDGGAVVNIMPHFMLRKLGLFDTDLHSHNVVLANYEGKTGHSLGAIQLEVRVGSTVRRTLFMVIAARPNYNLLLGREWIHGVGAVLFTVKISKQALVLRFNLRDQTRNLRTILCLFFYEMMVSMFIKVLINI
ncbi:hypothetical protein P8452_67908 [Trifolium repens]|nr:hypothetical protein P8452_67908 [Trifolium repens]